MKTEVDLIIYNTQIFTLDSSGSVEECVAVRDSLIIAVGKDAEIRSRYHAKKYIDGKGLFVYPGFIDAHSHFSGFAQYLNYADLNTAESFTEILEILKKYHIQFPDRWIIGRGWDQNRWPGKKFPDNTELNSLYPNVPVVLSRVDGHAVLANNAAIEAAGLTGSYPSGEAVIVNGVPTGVFLENTADRIRQAIPELSASQFSDLLVKAAELCHREGLTSVTDAGIDRKMILAIDSLQRAGVLEIRVDAWINPNEDNFNYFLYKGGFRNPFLRVGALKIYADGALGSRGACLLQPYADDSSTLGIMVTDAAEIARLCKLAFDNNFQVCTHAIGDSAVRVVVNAYSKILGGKNDLRWRVEHSQVVHPQDLSGFREFSIIPSVQTTHATSDMRWAKFRLGPGRIKNAYIYKQLLELNGWLPNGTDFPVEKISPIMTFYAAVTRKDPEGYPENGFQSENALSRLDALRSITYWAAKAAFEDKYKGSIEKGKYGDMVILDQDILRVPENQITKTKVRYTILSGKIIFDQGRSK